MQEVYIQETLEEVVLLNAEKAFGIQSHFIQPVCKLIMLRRVLITLLEGRAAEHVNSIREKAKRFPLPIMELNSTKVAEP